MKDLRDHTFENTSPLRKWVYDFCLFIYLVFFMKKWLIDSISDENYDGEGTGEWVMIILEAWIEDGGRTVMILLRDELWFDDWVN